MRRWLVTLAWALPLLLAAGLLVAVVGLRIAGYVPVVVGGSSMEPTIPYGSLAFTKETPVDDVHKGDVITFNPPGDTPRITHRVDKVVDRGGVPWFVTKGDANESIDDPQAWSGAPSESKAIPGVRYNTGSAPVYQFHVPYVGRPIAWLRQHPQIWLFALIVPMAIILVNVLSWIWSDELGTSYAKTRAKLRERARRRERT